MKTFVARQKLSLTLRHKEAYEPDSKHRNNSALKRTMQKSRKGGIVQKHEAKRDCMFSARPKGVAQTSRAVSLPVFYLYFNFYRPVFTPHMQYTALTSCFDGVLHSGAQGEGSSGTNQVLLFMPHDLRPRSLPRTIVHTLFSGPSLLHSTHA